MQTAQPGMPPEVLKQHYPCACGVSEKNGRASGDSCPGHQPGCPALFRAMFTTKRPFYCT